MGKTNTKYSCSQPRVRAYVRVTILTCHKVNITQLKRVVNVTLTSCASVTCPKSQLKRNDRIAVRNNFPSFQKDFGDCDYGDSGFIKINSPQ